MTSDEEANKEANNALGIGLSRCVRTEEHPRYKKEDVENERMSIEGGPPPRPELDPFTRHAAVAAVRLAVRGVAYISNGLSS